MDHDTRFFYRAKPRGGSDALAIGRACIDDIGQHPMTKARRKCAIWTLTELFITSLASDRREGTNPSVRENEGIGRIERRTVWKGESNSLQHGIILRLMPFVTSHNCARIIYRVVLKGNDKADGAGKFYVDMRDRASHLPKAVSGGDVINLRLVNLIRLNLVAGSHSSSM